VDCLFEEFRRNCLPAKVETTATEAESSYEAPPEAPENTDGISVVRSGIAGA